MPGKAGKRVSAQHSTFPGFRHRLAPEDVREQWQVLESVAKGRQPNRTTASLKPQVVSKAARRHGLAQWQVGRRYHAYVNATRRVLADAANLMLLEHAQQLGLCARRELADLIEEQCAAGRFLEQSRARADGPGERAPRVTEQFRFHQLIGERRAVHRQKPPIASRAEPVQRASNELLCRYRSPLQSGSETRWCLRGPQPRERRRWPGCAR